MTGRALASSVVVVLLFACARSTTAPAIVDAPPRALASVARAPASAPTTDPSWQSDPPTTWTDPRVVRGLTDDCDFRPPERRRPAGESFTPADLFRCTVAYEQSCVFDPCLGVGGTCQRRCADTCEGCGETCSASCRSCKTECKDDACRHACASSCAECKQTCARTMDRCGSGTCSHAYEACGDALTKSFSKNHCTAPCATYKRCARQCDLGQDPDCNERCRAKVNVAFQPCRDRCDDDADCIVTCYLASCSSNVCEAR